MNFNSKVERLQDDRKIIKNKGSGNIAIDSSNSHDKHSDETCIETLDRVDENFQTLQKELNLGINSVEEIITNTKFILESKGDSI